MEGKISLQTPDLWFPPGFPLREQLVFSIFSSPSWNHILTVKTDGVVLW